MVEVISKLSKSYLKEGTIKAEELEGIPLYRALRQAQQAKFWAWRNRNDTSNDNAGKLQEIIDTLGDMVGKIS
jgi:hypothetical protein